MIRESLPLTDERLRICEVAAASAAPTFAEDVRRGLTANPKVLFPKYFYDALGSRLFEAICELPEYYVTRAETEIFQRYAGEIAGSLDGSVRLVELGSGDARKTRLLIEALVARQLLVVVRRERLAVLEVRFEIGLELLRDVLVVDHQVRLVVDREAANVHVG